jgi:histone H3/H4
MKSVDFNTKNAPEKITEMTTEEEILAFIEGDERKTVIDAANKKIAELRGPKQGEQTDPITKDAADFKEGIQKTKAVHDSRLTNHESRITNHASRSFISCEDVLKSMREKGIET